MTGKRFRLVQDLRLSTRRAIIRLQDRLGPFADAFVVLVIGLAFLAVCLIFGIGSPSDWASFFAVFVVTAITVFFLRRASLQQSILVEVTMSYLVHGGRAFLDNLLGKLIGGTWRREELKPGDALFRVLEEISQGQDWEMKRRVAEALPALGEVDAKRALRIIGILRNDWDDVKWKSDLRRRAVEALTTSAVPGGIALLRRVKLDDVKSFLQLRERDEVYTAMAVAEAVQQLSDGKPDGSIQLRDDMLNFSRSVYPADQARAIEDLLDLLSPSGRSDVFALANKLEQMSASSNVFVRIAAARNIPWISDRLHDRALDLMLKATQPAEDVNVRRPISKERSVETLIRMLGDRTHQAKAEEVLWRLLADPDEIIRVTTFDKAEMLKDRDPALLAKICDFIAENETCEALLERAQRLEAHLS